MNRWAKAGLFVAAGLVLGGTVVVLSVDWLVRRKWRNGEVW
jgi:hypothetical protein